MQNSYTFFGLRIRAVIKKHYCIECNNLLKVNKIITKVKKGEEVDNCDFDKTTIHQTKDKAVFFSTVKLYCSKCDKNYQVEDVVNHELMLKMQKKGKDELEAIKLYEKAHKRKKFILFSLAVLLGNAFAFALSYFQYRNILLSIGVLLFLNVVCYGGYFLKNKK